MTDFEQSNEFQLNLERRRNVARFIQNVLAPARRTLYEDEVRMRTIEDFEAREYQVEAWNAIWQAREEGETHGLIHLATGLGKTSIAVFDYAKFRQEQESKGEGSKALFVVHQNNILEQASERFGDLLPEVSRSFYTNQQKRLPDTDITFATFQALYNGADKFPQNYFDYIIYDEAHHIEAETYKKVVDHFQPAFQLGLTATPVRMDEKDITEHFGEPVYSKTLPEAISEGHLATVNYNIVFDDAVKDAIDQGFDPTSIAEIQRLFDVEPRNEEIVRKIQEAQQSIKDEHNIDQVKTIVFCADLEHANDIAASLQGASYHSQKSRQDQEIILKSFRGDQIETMTVRDMFNEGVDIPEARLIVFLRTTSSQTIFEQQLGRGLRKTKSKKEVTVLDFVANIERIARVRNLAETISNYSSRDIFDDEIDDGQTMYVSGKNDKIGIKIHSDVSQFIFSQEIIDLLDKYASFSRSNGDIAPPGWISINDYARLVNSTPAIVRRALQSVGAFTRTYNFNGRNAEAIDPEQIQTLHNNSFITLEYMPDTMAGIQDVARMLRVTAPTINTRVEQFGWELPTYRVRSSGMPTLAFTTEQIEILKKNLDTRGIKAEDGWMSMNRASIYFDVSRKKLKSIIEDYDITLVKRVFGPASSYAISPEQMEFLKSLPELAVKRAPKGWKSIHQIAVLLKAADPTIWRIIEEHNIPVEDYKFGPIVAKAVSPEYIEIISQKRYGSK